MLEKGVAIGAILTLVVGMTQFIFKLRYCEVDDVVDNVIGTIIGVKLSVYLRKGIAVVYKIKKVGLFDFSGQIRVNSILYNCGKDMAEKYDLHHWDNSHFKNFIIVVFCVLKNSVYLVSEEDNYVATFQTRKVGEMFRFEKLACLPEMSGKGIGMFCINTIEKMALKMSCKKVCMEVYAPSKHALDFYLHRGYKVCGNTKTLKYSEIRMEKVL